MASFTREDTFAKVVSLVAKELKIESNKITESSTLRDLGADSLDLMKITMKLEELFGIEIDDEKAETLHNVKDVVDYVNSLRTK
jgi:acyl carrier protein